jgi:hypothetical protein
MVEEALDRMDGSSAPGWDGIPAKVFKVFRGVFVPRMWDVVQRVEKGERLPEEWKVALCVHVPKGEGRGVADLRPISLQQCKMRWLTTVLLRMMEGGISAVVPGCQAAFIAGRKMDDHVVQAVEWWRADEDSAWAAVDFAKAYDTVVFEMIEVALELVAVPKAWRAMYMDLLRGKVWFVLNGVVVQEVEYVPGAGIRQGDAFSPALFTVVMSVLALLLEKDCVGCQQLHFADDVLVKLPQTGAAGSKLRGVMELWSRWSGLKLNEKKTVVVLRNRAPGVQVWGGWTVVEKVRYLGVMLGHGSVEEMWQPALQKVWQRVMAVSRMGASEESKAWMVNMWVMPVARLQALAAHVPDKVCTEMQKAVRTAMGVRSWKVPVKVMYLGRDRGGLGLYNPAVYLRAVTATAFVRWATGARERWGQGLQAWCRQWKVTTDQRGLQWTQLGEKFAGWQDAPILADGLRSVSALRQVATGCVVQREELGRIPLWNSLAVRTERGHSFAAEGHAEPGITVGQVVVEGSVDGQALRGMRTEAKEAGGKSTGGGSSVQAGRAAQVCRRHTTRVARVEGGIGDAEVTELDVV